MLQLQITNMTSQKTKKEISEAQQTDRQVSCISIIKNIDMQRKAIINSIKRTIAEI